MLDYSSIISMTKCVKDLGVLVDLKFIKHIKYNSIVSRARANLTLK